MPAYKDQRIACLFFIAFEILGVFFLTNLLLGTVYNTWTELTTEVKKETEEHTKETLDLAFKTMLGHGDTLMSQSELSNPETNKESS